nr:MAG TPA: hypothetical protein [Caudoviricetes sp.]
MALLSNRRGIWLSRNSHLPIITKRCVQLKRSVDCDILY